MIVRRRGALSVIGCKGEARQPLVVLVKLMSWSNQGKRSGPPHRANYHTVDADGVRQTLLEMVSVPKSSWLATISMRRTEA